MKKLFFAAVVAVSIYARAAETNTTAQAWRSLNSFSSSQPPMSWQTNSPTQADLDKFDDQRAAESAMQADKARDFYTRFPDDTNAVSARVMEIQALQMAVHLGLTNHAADLADREQFIIFDTNAPVELRYELRLDQIGREMKAASASGADMQVEMEKAGRGLVKEFPSEPMGYELLFDVAENADVLKTRDLGELMADSGGPAELTGIGKGLLNQLDVVGKRLPVDFTTADGKEINAATLSNKVVLVDFWATWCPVCISAMPDLKKLYNEYHTNGFEIVGVNFDEDTNQARQFIRQNDLPWPQDFAGYGADNKFAQQFGAALPYVWLVDKKGIVQDIHGRKDTEAKIQKLLAQ